MAKLTLNTVSSGYLSTTVLNDNFTKIGEAIEKTLSRDGTMPNQMNTNLDMNGNTINNISDIIIDGVSVADSLVATYTALTEYSSLTTAHGVEGVIVGTTDAQTLSNKTISTGSSWEGNLISEGYGGTGLTSYNSGDTIYANAVDNLTTLPVGEQGQVLTVVDGLPKWSALSGTGLGDVSGPAFATSSNFVSFDGATGKIIKDSGKATPVGALVGTTDVQTLTNKTINSPSGLVKADVGLSVVDNTSDLNKPISTATQTALDGKASSTHVHTASVVTNTPAGNIAATTVQAAINELDSEKAALAGSASQSFSMLNGAVAGTLATSGDVAVGAASATALRTRNLEVTSSGTNDGAAVIVNKRGAGIATLRLGAADTATGYDINFNFPSSGDLSVYDRASGTLRASISSAGAVTIPGTLSLTGAASTLGYGTGAGGTVTQATSKSTAVTLNKPSGKITMNAEALAAGASVLFVVNNTLVGAGSGIVLSCPYGAVNPSNYRVEQAYVAIGNFAIRVTNISGSTLSQALDIHFSIVQGTTA